MLDRLDEPFLEPPSPGGRDPMHGASRPRRPGFRADGLGERAVDEAVEGAVDEGTSDREDSTQSPAGGENARDRERMSGLLGEYAENRPLRERKSVVWPSIHTRQ